MRTTIIASIVGLLLSSVASAQCPERLTVKETRSTALPTVRTPFFTQSLSSGHTLILDRTALERSLAKVIEGAAYLASSRHALNEALYEAEPPVDAATVQQALRGGTHSGFEVIDGVRVSQTDEERLAASRLLELAIQRAFVTGDVSLRREDGTAVDELTIELLVDAADPGEGDVHSGLRWVDRATRVLDYCFEPFSVRNQWAGPRQH